MAANRSVTGKYVGKSSVELNALKSDLQTAYSRALTRGDSYSRPGSGISFNFPSLQVISEELAEVEYALRVAGGSQINTTYADVSGIA